MFGQFSLTSLNLILQIFLRFLLTGSLFLKRLDVVLSPLLTLSHRSPKGLLSVGPSLQLLLSGVVLTPTALELSGNRPVVPADNESLDFVGLFDQVGPLEKGALLFLELRELRLDLVLDDAVDFVDLQLFLL